MILELDLGNTRGKWRVQNGAGVVASGVFVHDDRLDPALLELAIERVKIANVAAHGVLEKLCLQLLPLGVELEVAVSAKVTAGVVNGYAEPWRLGVDRWSAIVAAYQQRRSAVLVVDAGSAITVDLVDASGAHLGGYITPGLGLMRSSLLQNTGGVRFECSNYDAGVGFGCNTEAAVSAGVLASSLGVVLVAVAEAKEKLSTSFDVLLTGGDAGLLAELLPQLGLTTITVAPDLVLDGLQWLLP